MKSRAWKLNFRMDQSNQDGPFLARKFNFPSLGETLDRLRVRCPAAAEDSQLNTFGINSISHLPLVVLEEDESVDLF